GPTCHKGTDTCWGEKNKKSKLNFLLELENTIEDRKKNPTEESYTSKLFKKGINKIAQKVGEEAVETIIEAKDNNKKLFLNECADLIFHLMVLIKEKNYKLTDVIKVLKSRHK
ncbi:MAG: phosphoribosyl-ATP diphosphatase, partial [Bacteroidales bacterium]